MSMDMETSSSTKPENTSPKKAMGQHAAASGPGPGLPWARELLHRDSWAGPAAQVAAPESRAAAPHSLRACAWALLHLLWCGFLAILSKVLAVIWRCGQQLGLAQGTGSGTAAAAAAAGAESGAAAPHGPSCVPGPSATQEAHGQWAAPRVVLPELQNEEGDISEDVRSSTSGVESYSALLPLLMSTSDTSSTCSSDPKLLELWTGTKTEDQAAVKREDKNVIIIHTIWVNPRYPQLLMDPDLVLEDGEDAELPSTSYGLVAPRFTQPAGAAPARAPQVKEHPVRATGQPQEMAKPAACAAPGAQAAAAESRAAAPHSLRARGRALLHSLRRGSRAIRSRVAAVIRRCREHRATGVRARRQ